jgi:hypothetical protein
MKKTYNINMLHDNFIVFLDHRKINFEEIGKDLIIDTCRIIKGHVNAGYRMVSPYHHHK